MKLLRNSGNERVIDRLRDWLQPDAAVDFMSPVFSLYAFAEMHDHLSKIGHCRILLGSDSAITNSLYGGPADIAARGKLQGRWLAKIAVEWLSKHAEVRHVPTAPPQSMIIISENRNRHVLTGTCGRSEEHTSELQSLMRISYADFCLKKKNKQTVKIPYYNISTRNSNITI